MREKWLALNKSFEGEQFAFGIRQLLDEYYNISKTVSKVRLAFLGGLFSACKEYRQVCLLQY